MLPGQIVAATLIAAGTSLIPSRIRGRSEIALLALYGVVAAEFYGLVMDLFYWPIAIGGGTQLSFDTNQSLSVNASRFFTYHFVGALAWDIPRAILTATLIVIAGKSVLNSIRRSLQPVVVIERAIQP